MFAYHSHVGGFRIEMYKYMTPSKEGTLATKLYYQGGSFGRLCPIKG